MAITIKNRAIELRPAVVLAFLITLGIQPSARAQVSYAGRWDASLHAWSSPIHPRTIGVRVEVIDTRSLLPVAGATVRLTGAFAEERLGVNQRGSSFPRVQRGHFELNAQTAGDGIVVFALSWQKEYPWSQERPKVQDPNKVRVGADGRRAESWSYARSWIRPVDDIEKVQQLEVRHPQFEGVNAPLSFGHLIYFGQDISRELQTADVFDGFDKAWRGEIGNPAVVFCALRLGPGFGEFGNTRSTAPEFFERIRYRDFGIVYDRPINLTGLSRSEYAGPYLVYLVQVGIEPIGTAFTANPANRESSAPSRQESGGRARSRQDRDAARGENQGRDAARDEAERRRRKEEVRRAAEERRKAEEAARAKAEEQERQLRNEASEHPFGIAVKTLTNDRRKSLGLYLGTTGVVIEYVKPGSAAAKSGLRKNDVIETIVRGLVSDKRQFEDRTAGIEISGSVLVGFWRKNSKGKWERESRMISMRP